MSGHEAMRINFDGKSGDVFILDGILSRIGGFTSGIGTFLSGQQERFSVLDLLTCSGFQPGSRLIERGRFASEDVRENGNCNGRERAEGGSDESDNGFVALQGGNHARRGTSDISDEAFVLLICLILTGGTALIAVGVRGILNPRPGAGHQDENGGRP